MNINWFTDFYFCYIFYVSVSVFVMIVFNFKAWLDYNIHML